MGVKVWLKAIRIAVLVIVSSVTIPTMAQNGGGDISPIDWIKGSGIMDMEGIAQLDLPEGYVFTGKKGTQTLMELYQNPLTNTEVGYVASMEDDTEWFIVFEFSETGYVKDDEKDDLDADEMLKSFIKGTKSGNKARAKRGWPPLNVLGWSQVPKFNDSTKNLEWALKLKSKNDIIVNYNTRVLGRYGVMRVSLVVDPDKLEATLPEFRKIMDGFSYAKGNSYAEYRDGDKMADYGLKALVAGGAAAVAVKSGAFKWVWKLLVFGFVAVVGFFKKVFGRE